MFSLCLNNRLKTDNKKIKIYKRNNNKRKIFFQKTSFPASFIKYFLILLFTLITALFFNGCNAFNHQNGSLEGVVHVKKANSSTPVSGALISINGTTNTATTDQNGYFLLTEAPAGKRTVTIVKEGYSTLKLLNVFLEPNIVNKVYFGEPIILQPKEDTVLYNTAMEHLTQKEYQLALDALIDLRKNFPDSIWVDDAQYYIGNIYEINELYIMARDEYSLLLFYYPDSIWADDARMGIGNCYYYTGDYYNASVQFQLVIDKYPLSDLVPYAQYRVAWCYKRLNNNIEAIQSFQQVVTLYPQSIYAPPSQYFIGEIYYKLKNYEQAINAFHSTINNYPQAVWPGENRLIAPAAYFYTGYCYEEFEMWQEAIDAYQIIIDNYPNSTWEDGKSIAKDAQKRINDIKEKHLPPEEEVQAENPEI